MRVRDWMTGEPVTIGDCAPIANARTLMRQHRIRHLPVTREGELVGIISDRDLREARPVVATLAGASESFLAALERTEVGVLMASPCVTIGPDEPLERAAELMHSHRIGALPVVADGRILGLLAETDLLLLLVGALGTEAHGDRVVLTLGEDDPPLWKQLRDLEKSGRVPTRVATVAPRGEGPLRALVRVRLLPGA